MKKVLIAMCAAMAVMACTKTEVVFDEPNEIAFSPVSKFETKATASGTNFTANQNFYVFANTVASGSDASVAYFNNILFKNTGSENLYTGDPSQYWPNEKTLKFAGVTASGNIDGNTVKAEMTTWGTMTVTGYNQPLPSATDAKNDLMYFFDEGTDNAGYGKPANATTYVTPTMKHACSWIVVEVKLDSKLSGYWNDVKVNSVQFESLYTAGNVTLSYNQSASWTTSGSANSVSIFSGSTAINATTATKLESVENNTVVIPQTPTTLAVNITYTTPAGGKVTETIDAISLDYDGTEGNTAWAPGTKYTYTLTIGADEIKIAPKSEDWTSYDADGSEDGVQNIEQDVK